MVRTCIMHFCLLTCQLGFPGGSDGKEPACQCRRLWVQSLVEKIPWRRAWQPTPVFFPGEFHGQRSLAGYSPWGHRESDMTKRLTLLSHCPPASHPSFHSSSVLNTLLCFLPYLSPQPCQVGPIAVLTLTLLQRWTWVGHSALDYRVPRLPARITPLPQLFKP